MKIVPTITQKNYVKNITWINGGLIKKNTF